MTKAVLQETGIFCNDKRFDPSRGYKNCKHMKPTYIPNDKKKNQKPKYMKQNSQNSRAK